jgi:hypothetical protein
MLRFVWRRFRSITSPCPSLRKFHSQGFCERDHPIKRGKKWCHLHGLNQLQAGREGCSESWDEFVA